MADFLSTRGISYHLDEIIKKADSFLYILTPYLKFSETLYERLAITTERNTPTTIIYGKTELTKREEKLLNDLNCNIYFKENLHGKCYLNQDVALVTSMNLHSFSEVNNREFGVLLQKKQDHIAYNDCLQEVHSIIQKANAIKVVQAFKQEIKPLTYDFEAFRSAWLTYLTTKYNLHTFNILTTFSTYPIITANNFPKKGFSFSNKHGFAEITLKGESNFLNGLKAKEYPNIREVMKNYRVYWNAPDSICIYHAKGIEFETLAEDIAYCAEGLTKLTNEINRICP